MVHNYVRPANAALNGVVISTVNGPQVGGQTSPQLRAIDSTPNNVRVKLHLGPNGIVAPHGKRVTGHIATLPRPQLYSTVGYGAGAAAAMVINGPWNPAQFRRLLRNIPRAIQEILGKKHSKTHIYGHSLVGQAEVEELLQVWAWRVVTETNGARRREMLVAGRQVMCSYMKQHFKGYLKDSSSANQNQVDTLLQQIATEHANRAQGIRQTLALMAYPYLPQPPLPHIRGRFVQLNNIFPMNQLRNTFLNLVDHNQNTVYRAAIVGMVCGGVSLYASEKGKDDSKKMERASQALQLLGAVVGFFPPAAAAGGTAVIVGDCLLKHFLNKHMKKHDDLLNAANDFATSLMLDECYMEETNTFSVIVNSCLRLPK